MSFEDIIHNKSFDFINALNKTIVGAKITSPPLQDVSLQIIIHLISCISALRDTLESNQKPKTAVQTQVVNPLLNGLMATVGKVIMDNFAYEPRFAEQEAFAESYCSLMRHAFRLFPDMAVKRHKASGKLLLHHAAFRAKAYIVDDSIHNILTASPDSATVPDNGGALALHWATRNPEITSSGIDLLIKEYAKGVKQADDKGFMPLHWAVNQDAPNMDVVRCLLKAYPAAVRAPSRTGNLPLHYCVMRDRPNVSAVKALLAAFPDAISSRCSEGYLPIHRLVHRASVDKETLALLVKHYPDSLLQVTEQGQTPLLVALDFPKPDYSTVTVLTRACKEACARADLGDYYPLHMCLDCAKPDYKVALELLRAHPDAARKETKEGLTPLHLLVSTNVDINVSPDSIDREFVETLIAAHRESLVSVVKDIVPVVGDGMSVAVELLESWSGEWVEQSWDVIGKAKARGMENLALILEEHARLLLPTSSLSQKNNKLVASQPLKLLKSESLSPLTNTALPPRKFVLQHYTSGEDSVQPFSLPPEVDEDGYEADSPPHGTRAPISSSQHNDEISEATVTVISSLSGTHPNSNGSKAGGSHRQSRQARAPPAGPIPTSLLQAAENSTAMRLSKSQYELLLGRPSAVSNGGGSVTSNGTRRSRVSKKNLKMARQQRGQSQLNSSTECYSSDGGGGELSDYKYESESDRETDSPIAISSSSRVQQQKQQQQQQQIQSGPPPVAHVVQPRHRGPPPSSVQQQRPQQLLSSTINSNNNNHEDNDRSFASKTAPTPLATSVTFNGESNHNRSSSTSPRIKPTPQAVPEQISGSAPINNNFHHLAINRISPREATNVTASGKMRIFPEVPHQLQQHRVSDMV